MIKQTNIFLSLIILLGIFGPGYVKGQKPFGVARVHFEQNATDGDMEVIFEAMGGHEGLAKLTVVSPDGRTVIDFSAPESSTLGIRQFHFESPEPGDVQSLKSAYPEGAYTFAGATSGGYKLQGKSTLTHNLPATTNFVTPKEDAEDMDVHNLEITWAPIDNLAAYILYIELDEPDLSLTVRLPGSASKFTVPDGFLLPGKEYQLGIGTVAEEGNISFVETSFTTMEENSLNK
jgi:hypothetical protein